MECMHWFWFDFYFLSLSAEALHDKIKKYDLFKTDGCIIAVHTDRFIQSVIVDNVILIQRQIKMTSQSNNRQLGEFFIILFSFLALAHSTLATQKGNDERYLDAHCRNKPYNHHVKLGAQL